MIMNCHLNFIRIIRARHLKDLKNVYMYVFISRTYFCDVCEKPVGNAADYKQHVSEHATCGIDGCQYTAHQDILETHIRHQHLSGFYNRIVQGNTQEDIERWRAERRKNWPTHIRIAEKIVAQEAQRERGEVMHLRREKRRREDQSDRTNKELEEPEREWECNCRARHFVEGLRGRGRGRGRGRNWIPRNIRHQGHCRELELIRERAKEKREKRDAAFEEKREKRKLEAEERRKREGQSGEGEEKQEEKPKVKKMKVDHDACSSDEEGWNGGMWMFRGTVHMEEERLKQEKEEQIKTEETRIKQEHATSNLSSSLVSYENEDSDSDEAPEEIKTVVSFENDVPEDSNDHEGEKKSSKKLRKRKKKHNSGDADNAPEEASNAAEVALKEVRATIESHIQLFDNPPVPGEEYVVEERDRDNHDIIPEPPIAVEEFVEEPHPALPSEKPKQVVPVVFKKRLRHPTLLEKLLLSEIKSERNTILQCVRYVCKNNFFQDEKK